ncbi:MAG: hypothetical protein NE334_18060 [Lentisphaeraceae bacterium]|nr:hypothetical protein [Lentisphaeraceae bacterium]
MKRILFLLISFIFIAHTQAWTSSHQRALEELERLVPLVKGLPSDVKAKLYKEYSLFPDNNIPISETLVGKAASDYLKENNLYFASSLEKPEAMPHMFHLLIEALKERDFNKAALWIGSISHNLNDAASPHFLPSMYAVSQFSSGFRLKINKDQLLSTADKPILFLETLFNRSEGLSELKALKKDYKFELKTKDTQEISEYLATLPIYLRNASFSHSQYLVDSYQRNLFTTSKDFHNGNTAVARMGIIGIKATADVLNTAYEYAKQRIRYRYDKVDFPKIDNMINDIIKKRTLEQMPLFKEVVSKDANGKIGVLTESYYSYDESALGYSSRYLAASMMGTLKEAKESYRSLNLKDFLGKKLPSPKEMPILIVPACELTSGFRFIKKRDINKLLNQYANDGGRVLLISSIRAAFMGDLSFNLKTHKDETVFEGEIMQEAQVQYTANLGVSGTSTETDGLKVNSLLYKVVPKQFGWMNVKSSLLIDYDSTTVIPLALVKIDEEVFPIGGYLAREGNKNKANFIAYSNMAFYPYLFSDTLLSISEPKLDKVTKNIFLKSLDLLK